MNPHLAALARLAPSIAFSTEWTVDPHFRWNGDGPDPAEEGFQAYDVTVTAECVSQGQLRAGNAYLGGCYSKPGEHCPDVHGYWLQMAEEALSELPSGTPGWCEAMDYLTRSMHEAHAMACRDIATV